MFLFVVSKYILSKNFSNNFNIVFILLTFSSRERCFLGAEVGEIDIILLENICNKLKFLYE